MRGVAWRGKAVPHPRRPRESERVAACIRSGIFMGMNTKTTALRSRFVFLLGLAFALAGCDAVMEAWNERKVERKREEQRAHLNGAWEDGQGRQLVFQPHKAGSPSGFLRGTGRLLDFPDDDRGWRYHAEPPRLYRLDGDGRRMAWASYEVREANELLLCVDAERPVGLEVALPGGEGCRVFYWTVSVKPARPHPWDEAERSAFCDAQAFMEPDYCSYQLAAHIILDEGVPPRTAEEAEAILRERGIVDPVDTVNALLDEIKAEAESAGEFHALIFCEQHPRVDELTCLRAIGLAVTDEKNPVPYPATEAAAEAILRASEEGADR